VYGIVILPVGRYWCGNLCLTLMFEDGVLGRIFVPKFDGITLD